MSTHRSRAALWPAVLWLPLRALYRAGLTLFTLLLIGFSYATGGVPRIQPPEKKNRMTHVNPD